MEALEGVLETKDNTKMGQERAKSKIPRKLQSGLKPPKRILEALGGVLEILKALERVLGRPGDVWEASWRFLKASWRLLEARWRQRSAKIARDAPRAKFLGNCRAD